MPSRRPGPSSTCTPTLSLLVQRQEFGFHLGKQAGRDETITEDAGPSWQRCQPAVRPLVDIVLGDDYPARRVVQAEPLSDLGRYPDAHGVLAGPGMCDRQNDHEARRSRGLHRSDETGRPLLSRVSTGGGLRRPKIVVADDETWLRLRQGHDARRATTSTGRRALHAPDPSPPGVPPRQPPRLLPSSCAFCAPPPRASRSGLRTSAPARAAHAE